MSTKQKTNNMTKFIELILKDKRNCKSNNLQKFFRSKLNRRLNEVIEFDNELWFVSLGWLTNRNTEDGFAGLKVKEVACKGARARSYYPSWQTKNYKVVTDEFYSKWVENGILSFPEIWGERKFVYKRHNEFSTI